MLTLEHNVRLDVWKVLIESDIAFFPSLPHFSAMQSPYAANSDTFYAGCDKTKTSVIKVDEVSDVLEEAAPKVSIEL